MGKSRKTAQSCILYVVHSYSQIPHLIYAMPETPWSLIPSAPILCICYSETRMVVSHSHRTYLTYLIPTAPALQWLCRRHDRISSPPPLPYIGCLRHDGLSFTSPWLYICYAWETMFSDSQSPYLTYAIPETWWSLISNANHYLTYAMAQTRGFFISTAPTLHTLWPRHGSLSFPPPQHTYDMPETRWSLIPNANHCLTYAMLETRWSLISTAPTLHTLWPRHGGLSFPLPLPYIRYGRDTVVSHFHCPYLTYAMAETRWSLISTAPTLHTLWPRHGGLSFPPPLPYIRYGRDTVFLIPTALTLHMLYPERHKLGYHLLNTEEKAPIWYRSIKSWTV